jgi:Xaa-Pro dipeptidase
MEILLFSVMNKQQTPIDDAVEFLQRSQSVGAWVIYDYRKINPIFWSVMAKLLPSLTPESVTRPVFLVLPRTGEPWILVHDVDASAFTASPIKVTKFYSRQSMIDSLTSGLSGTKSVFMEYSPKAILPRVSRIDAGTIELVKSLKIRVKSSADILQYATQRWDQHQLDSHLKAAKDLTTIVNEAFMWIGMRAPSTVTEYEVHQFIRSRYIANNLETDKGPVVAVNGHGSDPHFVPNPNNTYHITKGDWILIDLWARKKTSNSVYADITWTGVYADAPTAEQIKVFSTVIGARNAATQYMSTRLQENKPTQGWQVDQVARQLIDESGYGTYFTHRLGHSLGSEVHSEAVNLDNWETRDSRLLIPGIGITVEPGIYLPHFGVRSEINVFVTDQGIRITTPPQDRPILIQ